MIIDYIILFMVVLGIGISLIYSLITGISPVPSSLKARKTIINSVSPDQDGYIYELGAGWGSLAFPVAHRCPKATVVAYEISPVPWLFMKIRSALFGPRNLHIVRRNFLNDNLGKASLVLCYLYPGAMTKLSAKLARELDSGANIICNTFELPAWTPNLVARIEDLMCPEIFYYKLESSFGSIKEVLDILATLGSVL